MRLHPQSLDRATRSGSLLASTTTDSSGGFTLGTYTCPVPNPYVYLTATGGNPGLAPLTNNAAISMLAALTDCNTLKANAATTFVFVDEVSTMGAASIEIAVLFV